MALTLRQAEAGSNVRAVKLLDRSADAAQVPAAAALRCPAAACTFAVDARIPVRALAAPLVIAAIGAAVGVPCSQLREVLGNVALAGAQQRSLPHKAPELALRAQCRVPAPQRQHRRHRAWRWHGGGCGGGCCWLLRLLLQQVDVVCDSVGALQHHHHLRITSKICV